VEKQKYINRRVFCVSLFAANVAAANSPLIDLKSSNAPIVSQSNKIPMIRSNDRKIVDVEPGLRQLSQNFYSSKLNIGLLGKVQTMDLRNAHTGEQMYLRLPVSLEISDLAKSQFDYLCRDWRSNLVKSIDPQLICILAKICDQVTDGDRSIKVEILSGYRTNKTNEMLRRKSELVAKNSFHKFGRALDFRLPGINTKAVQESAQRHAVGGLGIYKNFIHIDTGPQRRWLL